MNDSPEKAGKAANREVLNKDDRPQWSGEGRRLTWIFVTALLATLPMVLRGNSCGHDFDFHLQSWLQAAQGWGQGSLYPHWVAAANFGAGEPRLVFYPPASWMLGAALGTVLPWKAAGGVFVLIALAGSGLSLYAMAREWVPSDAAALAASIYIVNPYSMFVAYERGALGELLAGVWVPLIVLFALRRRREGSRDKSQHGSQYGSQHGSGNGSSMSALWGVAPLALSVAAVWVTNAPAAVMCCYMLAVVAAVATICERRWWPVARALAGSSLGIALAAFYIVPAAYERRWVDIGRAIAPGMRVEDSFLFGHTGEAFHDQVLRTASSIAVAMMTAIAAALFVAWRTGGLQSAAGVSRIARLRETTRKVPAPEPLATNGLAACVWIPFVVLPVFILLLMLPMSDVLWRHAPELKFLQFPWRWLLIAIVSGAMLTAVALRSWFDGRAFYLHAEGLRWRRPAITSVILLALAGTLIALEQRLFWQPCDDEDMVPAQVEAFRGSGFAGTDEYTTPGTDNEAIQQGLPPVRFLAAADQDEADSSVEQNPVWSSDAAMAEESESGGESAGVSEGGKSTTPVPGEIQLESWSAESKRFTVKTAAPGFAVLRLLDYPAWEVRVNGVTTGTRPHRADGLMTIPLRAGSSSVSVYYATTRDVRWGRAVTVAALVILLLLALRQRRNRNRR